MMVQSGTAGIVDGLAASGLSAEAIAYANSRKISRATLERLGAASGTTYFPRRLDARSEAIFFPYVADGKVVNYKAVAFPRKDFIGKKGGRLVLFNIDVVVKALESGKTDTVYIVEGEFDVAALVESGIPLEQVVSVPNGAQEEADPDDLKGYGFVEEALARGLNRAKRFVFCGDSDDAGRTLRQVMVKLLGAARFWFVDWPEGCKDANDYLKSDGPEAVRDLVMNGAQPWPVAGLYTMSELPEPPALTLWNPGFLEWESKVMLAPGTMSVVTGHPNHGKTALWAQIWFQVIERYGVSACIASFETRAKPHHRRTLRTLLTSKLEKDLDWEELRKADAWIDRHYKWIQHPDQRPTLEWALEMAEVAVVRHGVRILQLDPWNRMEGGRMPGESETDYIGRCLTAIYVFAQDMNCHVQILAHPAKMSDIRRGKPPELEDIAGSKHWDNRVDQGFVVHRPKLFENGQRCTEAVLYHKKSRFEELGYPCQLNLEFDLEKRRYISTDYKMRYEA